MTIALVTLLAASACVLTLPAAVTTPVVPTPNMVMTGKIQTLTAAPTPTFTVTPILPTETPSITLTPFPSITPLPTATATVTETPFGYVEPATAVPPTPTWAEGVETPDPAEGATDDYGSDYRCTLTGKSPADWTTLPAGSMYKVKWTLLNSGKRSWQSDGIVLMYIDGTKLGPEKALTLIRDVKVNQSITPVVNIITPKAPGHYRTVWALRLIKSNHVFCSFTIKITIQ